MRALILVDIQNDFLPGGALAVPHGDAVVAVAKRMAAACDIVVATQDWHPAHHQSFAAQHPGKSPYEVIDLHGLPQVLWPVHCVQNTVGAAFADALDPAAWDAVFPKGTHPTIDSYSGFFDNGHRQATGLGDWLAAKAPDDVYVMGLATDYCVKFTALDAVALGFRTHLIEDGCRGVGLGPRDIGQAIADMRGAGVTVTTSQVVAG